MTKLLYIVELELILYKHFSKEIIINIVFAERSDMRDDIEESY